MTVTTNMVEFASCVLGMPPTPCEPRHPRCPSPTKTLTTPSMDDRVFYNGDVWTLADKDYKAFTGFSLNKLRKATQGRYILCNGLPVYRLNEKVRKPKDGTRNIFDKAESLFIKKGKLYFSNTSKNGKVTYRKIDTESDNLFFGEGRII